MNAHLLIHGLVTASRPPSVHTAEMVKEPLSCKEMDTDRLAGKLANTGVNCAKCFPEDLWRVCSLELRNSMWL